MIYLGVDPGKSGAVVAIYDGFGNVDIVKCAETEADISEFFRKKSPSVYLNGGMFAYLEQVAARPGQGVSSMFKFGQSYGFLRGMLIAHRIPFETVTPSKWQGYMKCRSGGDKNVTKARAQELFPDVKVTHAIADALLLAEFCRRVRG